MDRRSLLQAFAAAIGLPLRPAHRQPQPPAPPAIATGVPPAWLKKWLTLPIQPVIEKLDMSGRQVEEILNWLHLQDHITRRASLVIHYHGGSNPGQLRRITPSLVFHKITSNPAPPLHVFAWCHLRNDHRTFRLEHMSLPERHDPRLR